MVAIGTPRVSAYLVYPQYLAAFLRVLNERPSILLFFHCAGPLISRMAEPLTIDPPTEKERTVAKGSKQSFTNLGLQLMTGQTAPNRLLASSLRLIFYTFAFPTLSHTRLSLRACEVSQNVGASGT